MMFGLRTSSLSFTKATKSNSGHVGGAEVGQKSGSYLGLIGRGINQSINHILQVVIFS